MEELSCPPDLPTAHEPGLENIQHSTFNLKNAHEDI
jgi:hypothetical protein